MTVKYFIFIASASALVAAASFLGAPAAQAAITIPACVTDWNDEFARIEYGGRIGPNRSKSRACFANAGTWQSTTGLRNSQDIRPGNNSGEVSVQGHDVVRFKHGKHTVGLFNGTTTRVTIY